MKKLSIYLIFIFSFGLLFSVSSSYANTKYCATADFVKIFKTEWNWNPCDRDEEYAPHFDRWAPLIRLNREIYVLMDKETNRVLDKLKD